MKRIFKRILYGLFIVPSIIVISLLTSCTPDMGIFGDEEDGLDEYYDSIGDISGKYELNNEFQNHEYDLEKSLCNDYIIEHLAWEDDNEMVEFRQYVYIVIPFKRELTIESIALFVRKESGSIATNQELELSFFYYPNSSSCPKDDELKKMSDPDTKIEKDSNGNDVEVEATYADPKKESRNCSTKLPLTDSFDSFEAKGFRQTVDYGESYVANNCLLAKKDSYLYVRVENNSALNRNMTPISIQFINLLVRAI